MWRKYIWGQGETKDDSIIQSIETIFKQLLSASAKIIGNTTEEVSNTNYYTEYVVAGLTVVAAVFYISWRNIFNHPQSDTNISEIKATCEELKTKIKSKYDEHNVSKHIQNAFDGAKAGASIGTFFGFMGGPRGAILGALIGAGISSATKSPQKDNRDHTAQNEQK